MFNGMGGSERYRALIIPELFPEAKPWLFRNWHEDDIVDYWIDMEEDVWA
jgi:hypothetical protein